MEFRLRSLSSHLVLLILCGALSACPSSSDGPADEDAGAFDAGDAGANEPDDDGGIADAGEDAGSEDAGQELDAGDDVDAGSPEPGEPDVPPSSIGTAYWQSIDRDLTGQALVDVLHERVAATHDRVSFDNLFRAYATVDQGRGCGDDIFDIYSSRCWAPEDKCGQYSAEGDCFNREHLWPKSWWGGQTGRDAHSDLFVVVPTDGFVNGKRANFAFGETSSTQYTSTNGSVLGNCADDAVPFDDCFAPASHVRGDIARAFFYFAVRYEAEFTCCNEASVTNADIDAWQEAVLRRWHLDDPVDDDERERNERVFVEQRNRNPFIDYPSLVFAISDF